MLVAIDAVGIRGQGGAAVLQELLDWLPQVRPDWRWQVFLLSREYRDFDDPQVAPQVTIESTRVGHTEFGRLWWVHSGLPNRIRALQVNVLFSLANVGTSRPCVPQVVFCQQALAFMPGNLTNISLFKQLRMRMLRELILSGARNSRAVIVQTEAMKDMMAQLEPSLEDRLAVIPSGYRTDLNQADIRGQVRSLLEGSDHPRLFYLSHPGEHKNHLRLIQAMAIIHQEIPQAKLFFPMHSDHGPDRQYTKYVQTLKKAAKDYGIEDQLVWMGVLNCSEVNYVLTACDLHVFPSLAESFGLGLAESMAAGCPIATADLPYAHNVAGEAAEYFDPEDPQAIADCVLRTLRDSALLDRLRAAARFRKERFSYQRIAEQIAQVLQRAKTGSRLLEVNLPLVPAGGAQPITPLRSDKRDVADVSVIILTFNEEKNLPAALDSVCNWAKEVFVVDSFSTDRTVDIALERAKDGVRVVQHAFVDYSTQWNWALEHLPLSRSWTMKMDADERLTPEFKSEVVACIGKAPPDLCGLYFRRRQTFQGREMHWGMIAGNYVLHLWRTGTAKFENRPVNEHVLVSGRKAKVSASVIHHDSKSLSEWIRKHERYSSMEARSVIEGNVTGDVVPSIYGQPDEQRMWLRRLYRYFPFRNSLYFIYRYLLCFGFLDHYPGFVYCFMHAVYLYWVDLKIREFRITGRLPEVIWPPRGQPHPVVQNSPLQLQVDTVVRA